MDDIHILAGLQERQKLGLGPDDTSVVCPRVVIRQNPVKEGQVGLDIGIRPVLLKLQQFLFRTPALCWPG